MTDYGLTVAESELVAMALDERLRGATITDAALLVGRDDLCLFVDLEGDRRTLHVAPGGRRARVTITARRFARDAFDRSPRAHHAASLCTGQTITAVAAVQGQRCIDLRLAGEGPVRTLHVELFGPRGLWVLCDADERILALSRLPNEAARPLRPGTSYVVPSAPPKPDERTPRFQTDVLAAVDRHFSAADVDADAESRRNLLTVALERARRRVRDRLAGLDAQQLAIEGTAELRSRADLLLAYGASLPRDATELRVPDPLDPDREVVVPLDGRTPFAEQARRIYDRARRLDASAAIAAQKREEAQAEIAALDALAAELAAAGDDEARLGEVHAALARRGVVPKPPTPKDRERERKLTKITRGENFRRFRSSEGHLIMVGRDNAQNDRLSIKVARGQDLWLHVGRGYAGSHVVVRIEKGRQASLETLLEAGTLAIHFSKVRGAEHEEVIYTQARHVKKPKGLPPGKVLAHQTRSIRVKVDPERLRRVLSSGEQNEATG